MTRYNSFGTPTAQRGLVVVFVSILSSLYNIKHTDGCSCFETNLTTDLMNEPMAVRAYVGRVTEQDEYFNYYKGSFLNVFKGNETEYEGELMLVRTPREESMCGVQFYYGEYEQPVRYLLFGDVRASWPTTDGELLPIYSVFLCNYNRPFTDLTSEEKQILKNYS